MRRFLARWPSWLQRPWAAVALAALVAAAVLLPGLGSPGMWEPQELARADAALARVEAQRAAAAAKAPPPAPPPPAQGCAHQPPAEPMARSLTDRALAWTMRDGQPSEQRLRLPMALLGLLTVVASAGIAARWAGGRAALLCALLLLSFPLLVLQARQLTSELGTAAGAALTIYGMISLRPIGASLWAGRRRAPRAPLLRTGVLHLLDDALSLLALAAGLTLGFLSGGGLLGVLVPLLAFAAAAGFGGAALAAFARLGRRAWAGAVATVAPRRALGDAVAHRPWGHWVGDRNATWFGVKGLVAGLAALGLLYVLADHAFNLGPLQPGTREVLGRSIIPTNCYSWALGGTWQSNDDLRVLYDSSVEQIAFGTFPWGLLAPLAIAGLFTSARRSHRLAAALCLAWASIAWVATEVFQRKVGFTIYAGFPALALAVALWIDGSLDGSLAGSVDKERDGAGGPAPSRLLLGLFLLLGAITLGKDLQTFPERLTSLLLGDDAVKYPTLARWLWIPTRVWILVLGTTIALSAALWMWRREAATGAATGGAAPARRGQRALSISLAATAALAGFWVHGWQASLSRLLSSKNVFASYQALRHADDRLVIFGDLGNAPRYYAGGSYETVQSREALLAALAAPGRVFALAPASELCYLQRQAAGKPYYVLDNDNARTLLLSNRVDGTTDHNPLATSLYDREPPGIAQRPSARIVFDDRIEIIGWSLPRAVAPGQRFPVTIFYKILAPVGGTWRVFQHYDRAGARFSGDHVPISGRCPTSDWQAGDYIADRFEVEAGLGVGSGSFDLWTGFFTGAAPSWHNMPVTLAPAELRDSDDRVKITSILLR